MKAFKILYILLFLGCSRDISSYKENKIVHEKATIDGVFKVSCVDGSEYTVTYGIYSNIKSEDTLVLTHYRGIPTVVWSSRFVDIIRK